MSTPSPKPKPRSNDASGADTGRTDKAKEPTRKRGHERVAQLMDGAMAVFEERGYAGATMTEIAARAGAPIGSLYQFFPSKQSLVDALVQRYGEHVFEALDVLDSQVDRLDAAQFARALLSIFMTLRRERLLVLRLLDSTWQEPTTRPPRLRNQLRSRIAQIVMRWAPGLEQGLAQMHAIVILQMMKSHMQITLEEGLPYNDAAVGAWEAIFETYLADLRS